MLLALLNAALLRDSAPRSVRVIAQARLQRVLEEAARVELGADPEAIHDFRVALRRLRAWLRAFRPYLSDTVRHGPERRLRTLSRLAGRARDLEVQYQWLTGPRQRRFGTARIAARWLAEEIGRGQARARRRLAEGLLAELPGMTAKLTAQLQHYRRDTALEEPSLQPMAAAMAEALRHATETLAGSLQRVRRPEEVAEAHVARIAIKRLRYLLEAFRRNPRSVASILFRLTVLQHQLGELHDAQVLRDRLQGVRSARKRRGSRAGKDGGSPTPTELAALRALVARRVPAAFRLVDRAIRSSATQAAMRQLAVLSRRLETGVSKNASRPRQPRFTRSIRYSEAVTGAAHRPGGSP